VLQLGLGERGDRPLSILCLGAHSDDIEIGCGGTVLRLLEEHPGSSIRWVVFSANADREQEARASAASFTSAAASALVEVHQFRESYFPFVGAPIKDVFELLKQGPSPDVVFSHRRDDVHQDHRTIGELVWNTFRNHLILEYEIPKYEGDLGQPNVFVPLSAEIAQAKVDKLVCGFPSQRTKSWFRPETFRGIMSLRAVECNAPEGAAEAFHGRKVVL